MSKIIPFQNKLRQVLPVVTGNADYSNFKNLIMRVSDIIELSKIDKQATEYEILMAKKELKPTSKLSDQILFSIQQKTTLAIRCIIARKLTKLPYRAFSIRLAESSLLQHFCQIDHIDIIKVPSKSSLERYEKMFPEEIIRELNTIIIKAATTEVSETEDNLLKLEEGIDLDGYFADSTCVKANIHYPVDWVLLRDATRTLIKAVKVIRRHGLKNRMDDPSCFINDMNKLCINMTHTKGRKDGRKKSKKVFRLMKKMMKKIALHGLRHQELLENRWQETDLSEKEAKQIITRIENILKQLPEAIRQGHERIIGGRLVKDGDKILSLYDKNISTAVRGKAGARVEFGNTLFLAEQGNGVIIDWKLFKNKAPSDSKILKKSLERLEKKYDEYKPKSVTTDRGFFSKHNQKYLEKKGITDYMCPRSVPELSKRLKESEFCKHQKRRAQTEGRIGIIKNCFLGNPSTGKDFNSRNLNTAWSVLSHNLWVLARLPRADMEIDLAG
jgi:hypothetical protein